MIGETLFSPYIGFYIFLGTIGGGLCIFGLYWIWCKITGKEI